MKRKLGENDEIWALRRPIKGLLELNELLPGLHLSFGLDLWSNVL